MKKYTKLALFRYSCEYRRKVTLQLETQKWGSQFGAIRGAYEARLGFHVAQTPAPRGTGPRSASWSEQNSCFIQRTSANEFETTPTPGGDNETQIGALRNRTQRLQMNLGDGPLESHEQGLSNGPSPRTTRGH